jgi:hypothetical protein
MRHLATIQSEFLKIARDWDDLTYEEQKSYLDRHPQSKRKITTKPGESKVKSADQIIYLLVPKKYNGNWQEASNTKDVTVVADGESLTEEELNDTQKEYDADLVRVSASEAKKFFRDQERAERVTKFDDGKPVKQYLLDQEISYVESKLKKLIEMQAPDVIIEQTKNRLEDAKSGQLAIKNIDNYDGELIDTIETVVGRGGRKHTKITTKSGKIFGIFNGMYSTFAADWKS